MSLILFEVIANERYETHVGPTLAREHASFSPNGNPTASKWVLRDVNGAWIDCDRYRTDLAERHGLRFA